MRATKKQIKALRKIEGSSIGSNLVRVAATQMKLRPMVESPLHAASKFETGPTHATFRLLRGKHSCHKRTTFITSLSRLKGESSRCSALILRGGASLAVTMIGPFRPGSLLKCPKRPAVLAKQEIKRSRSIYPTSSRAGKMRAGCLRQVSTIAQSISSTFMRPCITTRRGPVSHLSESFSRAARTLKRHLMQREVSQSLTGREPCRIMRLKESPSKNSKWISANPTTT